MANPSILIFTDWFYPGFKAGGPIRSIVNLVDALESKMSINIFTSDRDFQDTSQYNDIIPNKWVKYGESSRIFYASPNYLTMRNIRGIIDDVNPSTVYLNSMWSLHFTLYPLWAMKGNHTIKKVLAPRGMLKKSAMEIKYPKKLLSIWFLKAFGILNNCVFHSTDLSETQSIGKYFSNSIFTLENIPKTAQNFVCIEKCTGSIKLVYISRIHPIKNLIFLLNALLQMPRDISVEFNVYGPKEDNNYFEECKRIASKSAPWIKVCFKGSLHNSLINSILQSHHFFVLPTKGENFGHAIFESFSAGRPVIISDQTPWRRLENKQVGFDLPLDKPNSWTDKIKMCAEMNQEEYDIWSHNAYNFAMNYSANTEIRDNYIQLFSQKS